MSTYIVRRLIQAVVILIMVTVIVFISIHLLPSDPIVLYVSSNEAEGFSQEKIAMLKHEYGLDKPIPVQYINWMGNVLKGDLGKSITIQEKVSHLISTHLPVSIYFGSIAFIISGIFGVTIGVICALRRGTWIDNLLTVLANFGITTPNFWLAILLIYLLAYKLQLLPIYGYTSPFENLGLSIQQIIIPVFCLALGPTAGLARQTRSSMLEVIQQEYIRTAWSKGLRERDVIIKHALKNGFTPIITMLGMQARNIVGGQVFIETVFSIPGIGLLMVDGVRQQDFQVVQGGTLIIGIAVLLCNLAVDISYRWLDPRIKFN